MCVFLCALHVCACMCMCMCMYMFAYIYIYIYSDNINCNKEFDVSLLIVSFIKNKKYVIKIEFVNNYTTLHDNIILPQSRNTDMASKDFSTNMVKKWTEYQHTCLVKIQ